MSKKSDLQALARRHTPEAIKALADMVTRVDRPVSDKDRAFAANSLIQWGWGMPVQQNVTADVGAEYFEHWLDKVNEVKRDIERERRLEPDDATDGSA